MSAIAYRPEVDGLRAVAILGVLLFHVFPRLLPGGFAGVDVFFVISGYLITSILLEEIQKGIFSLKRFYLRRVRRLFPALAIVLLVILIVSPLLNPFSTSTVRSAVTWVLLLSGNIFIWRATGDYWGPNVDENPLLHTWSLGVEEQFYLLFPLTLLLLMRFGRRRAFQLLALFCLGSFLCCVVGTRVRPSAAFYLPLTRAWELLAGCLLAFKARNPVAPLAKNNRSGLWAGIGLVLIVISYATLKGDHSFPGFKAALPVLGSVIVIGFTGRGTGAADWLLKRPAMVFIGKISYSLYLWHWPVLVFLRQISENPLLPPLLPREFTGVGCFILSTLLALASYAVIERPGRA